MRDVNVIVLTMRDVNIVVLDYSDSTVYMYKCQIPEGIEDESDYIEERLMKKHKLSQISWMVHGDVIYYVDGGRI